MCGAARSCPAGGRRGASASRSACPPSTGVANGRAVSASRASGARLGAHCLLGRGSPLAHLPSRPGVASQSDGSPAPGRRRSPVSVHCGRPQPAAPSREGDSAAGRARCAPGGRSGRAREADRLRGLVCRAARRAGGPGEPSHMSAGRWPRRAVLVLIRLYQSTLSRLVFTQCRFQPSCSRYTYEAVSGETVWVTSPAYRLGFSTRGASLVSAELLEDRSFSAADSGRPVQLVPAGRPWLRYALTAGGDTVALADWSFTPGATRVRLGEGRDSALLSFTAARGGARIELEYRFVAADYRFAVQGRFAGFGSRGATLLVGLGDGLRSVEADSMDDFRHYAVVTKAAKTQSTDFQALKPGERRILDGPFEWAGVKSKYFFLAALAFEENQPRFGAAIVEGGPRTVTASSLLGRSAVATRAAVTLTLPVPPAGDFRYQLYAGPLEHRRLAQLDHDLDDANPYGGVPRPPIPPPSAPGGNNPIWRPQRPQAPPRPGSVNFGR